MVSIRLMTYNHEDYIEEALNGIDIQKTNFDVELVVGDDFSLDQTLSKIRNFKFTNERIKLNILERSKGDAYDVVRQKKGRLYNFENIYSNCIGTYVALLDGDDFWTDPLKLQKQVDFMEANLDFAICFHSVSLFDHTTKETKDDLITRNVSAITDVTELSHGNYIHTPSALLRNDFKIPSWFTKSATGDWTLYMIAVKDRKIKKIDEIMASYRENCGGIWSGKTGIECMDMTIQSFSLVHKEIELDEQSIQNLKAQIDYTKQQRKKSKLKSNSFKKKLKKYLGL